MAYRTPRRGVAEARGTTARVVRAVCFDHQVTSARGVQMPVHGPVTCGDARRRRSRSKIWMIPPLLVRQQVRGPFSLRREGASFVHVGRRRWRTGPDHQLFAVRGDGAGRRRCWSVCTGRRARTAPRATGRSPHRAAARGVGVGLGPAGPHMDTSGQPRDRGCTNMVLGRARSWYCRTVTNPAAYRPRLADAHLGELLAEFPAVMINGARATGKTTTARQHVAEVLSLDVPGVAASMRADPDAALRRVGRPVLLDEWQEAPEVLGAVKRAVDRDSRPGQFLLTGSVRAELSNEMWAGTGRIVRLS